MKTYRLKCFMEGGNGEWGKSAEEVAKLEAEKQQLETVEKQLEGTSELTSLGQPPLETQKISHEPSVEQEQTVPSQGSLLKPHEIQWIKDFMTNVVIITKTIPIEKQGKKGWAFGYTTSVMIYLCEVISGKGNIENNDVQPGEYHELFMRAKKALGSKEEPNIFNVVIFSEHIDICDDIFINNMNKALGCPNIQGTTSITFVHEVPDEIIKHKDDTNKITEIPVQKIDKVRGHIKNMESINNLHNKLNKCNVTT